MNTLWQKTAGIRKSAIVATLFLAVAGWAFAQSPTNDGGKDGRFSLHEGRVVRDSKTNLEWWPAPDRNTTWYEAKRWAEYAAQFNGRWRMPTLEELETLHGPELGPHGISPLLQVTAYTVWADKRKGERSAWCFDLETGKSSWFARHRSGLKRAIAVRPIQTSSTPR